MNCSLKLSVQCRQWQCFLCDAYCLICIGVSATERSAFCQYVVHCNITCSTCKRIALAPFLCSLSRCHHLINKAIFFSFCRCCCSNVLVMSNEHSLEHTIARSTWGDTVTRIVSTASRRNIGRLTYVCVRVLLRAPRTANRRHERAPHQR